ncbi:hypothetical protein ACVIGA_000232 [Bradyrhizobium sp. USDA 3240]
MTERRANERRFIIEPLLTAGSSGRVVDVARTLPRIVAAFDRRFPVFRSPEDCAGLCCWASELFASAVPGARMIHLLGSRRNFLNRVDDFPTRDPFFYHVVAVVRGQAFGWTRRQLEPRARHPFVQPVAELWRDWIRLGRSPEELGL